MALVLALSYRARQVYRPGIQKELFSQRRLAGIRVGDDRERSSPSDLTRE
jgi:hypothetical protein